jgi:hypothetical protein
VNIAKARLEGLFVDELERLQPSPGYMRLLKESVLQVWYERKSAVRGELEDVERRSKGCSNESRAEQRETNAASRFDGTS